MVSPDIIWKSFLKTGKSNSLDDTQDHLLFNSASESDDDPFEGFEEDCWF